MRLIAVGMTSLLLAGLPNCGQDPTPHVCGAAEPSGLVAAKGEVVEGQYIVKFKQAGGVAPAAAQNLRSKYGIDSVKAIGPRTVRVVLGSAAMTRGAAKTAEQIAKDPAVQYVVPVQRIKLGPITKRQGVTAPKSWGIDRVNQRNLPLDGNDDPGAYGEGVLVGTIDTGVDCSHPEFRNPDGSSRCVASYSVFGTTGDPHGHGSYVTSTEAGQSVGIARKAGILSCQFLNAQGSGDTAGAVECINWMVERHAEFGKPLVVNNSWGGPDDPVINKAMCDAIAAGVWMSAAAGNSNLNACNDSPGRVDQVFTVGAVDDNDHQAGFSNTGTCNDCMAPGVQTTGAVPGGGYESWDGTSMAAPHATGVAALCAEAGMSTPQEITDCVVARSTKDTLTGLIDSPNRLVYTRAE